jgi:hypothetical protein
MRGQLPQKLIAFLYTLFSLHSLGISLISVGLIRYIFV